MTLESARPRTLLDKIWTGHVAGTRGDGREMLYIDRAIMDDVRGPDAIRLLEAGGRAVRRPDLTFATFDHTIGTQPGRDREQTPAVAAIAAALRAGAARYAFRLFDAGTAEQGISHVVAPELGLVLPGSTYVCSDSHAGTVGALGALGFGCGSTDLAHLLATQVIALEKPPAVRIRLSGVLHAGVSAKDVALKLLGMFGTAGARGSVVEYCGPLVRALTMEGRFTLCNMAIEMGARSAIIAPDETTLAWLDACPIALDGAARAAARAQWRDLASDEGAHFDLDVDVSCDDLAPQITWGTDPAMVVPITGTIPDPAQAEPARRVALERALEYMGLAAGDTLLDRPVERVFIGSCTNARLDDLRRAAAVVRGRVAPGVRAIVVPGSSRVKREAEELGLAAIFTAAGFEWHESGCSMCSSGSADSGEPGQRCAATSNRNFENRQGRGVRTHLVSPESAVAAALAGRFVDVRRPAGA